MAGTQSQEFLGDARPHFMSGISWRDPASSAREPSRPRRSILNPKVCTFVRALGDLVEVDTHWRPMPTSRDPDAGRTVPHLRENCPDCRGGNTLIVPKGYAPVVLFRPDLPEQERWTEERTWHVPGLNLDDVGTNIRSLAFEVKPLGQKAPKPFLITQLPEQVQRRLQPLTIPTFDVKLVLMRIWGMFASKQVWDELPWEAAQRERQAREAEEQAENDRLKKQRNLFDDVEDSPNE
jgi:hypothetical protein